MWVAKDIVTDIGINTDEVVRQFISSDLSEIDSQLLFELYYKIKEHYCEC